MKNDKTGGSDIFQTFFKGLGKISGFNFLNEEVGMDESAVPNFDLNHSGNVTAVLDKTAILNCRVKNIGNKTVSVI